MISRGESKIRKWIGSALFIFTLALFFYKASYGSVISCGLFSFGLGAGICVVRTGLESQWGCIVKLHWKPDGPKTRSAPIEFAKEKRKQFFANIFQSLFAGMILALLIQIITQIFYLQASYNLEYFISDVISCIYYGIGGIILVFVLGYIA